MFFFDTLINLRPIAEYSARGLYKANYREFLSSALEGGRQTNIHTHCWHVITPRSAEWDDFTPPPSYHPNDAEDPEKPLVQKESKKKRYSIKSEGAAIPVTDSTYDFDRADPSFIQKMPPVRSIRDEQGLPMNASLENVSLDNSIRTFPRIVTEQTRRHMTAFLERAANKELAIYGDLMNEAVQNMSIANQSQHEAMEQGLNVEELEEGEEYEPPLIGEFQNFQQNMTAEDIIDDPAEGWMLAELITDKVILQGTYGRPFKGGFQILRDGDLIYMSVVPNRERYEGFEGTVQFQVNKYLAFFLHDVARMCGDENTTPDMFCPGGGGGGGGNNSKGDNNDDTKKKSDDDNGNGHTTLDLSKSSTPKPGAKRHFRRERSSIPPTTPVTSSTTPATPAIPGTTPTVSTLTAIPGTSTSTQEVIIDFPIRRPLQGFAAQNVEQLPSLSSLRMSGNYQNIIRLLWNYYEFTVTHSDPHELYCENISGLIEMLFMNWHLNELNHTAVEVTCSVGFTIA